MRESNRYVENTNEDSESIPKERREQYIGKKFLGPIPTFVDLLKSKNM